MDFTARLAENLEEERDLAELQDKERHERLTIAERRRVRAAQHVTHRCERCGDVLLNERICGCQRCWEALRQYDKTVQPDHPWHREMKKGEVLR